MDFHLDLLEAGKVDLIQNLVLPLDEVFLLELDLLRDGGHFLLEAVNFFFVNWHRLQLAWLINLVAQPTPAIDWGLLGLVDRLLDSLLEVNDLVESKVLVYLHLFLEVFKFAFVYQL